MKVEDSNREVCVCVCEGGGLQGQHYPVQRKECKALISVSPLM